MAMPLAPPMRTTPANTLSGGLAVFDGSVAGTATGIGSDYSTSELLEFDLSGSGFGNIGRAAVVYQSGSGSILSIADL